MTIITQERTMSHARASVWKTLADFGSIHKFYALVDDSCLHEGSAATGMGAARTCHFSDGNKVLERIIDFKENERLVVDIYDGTMPLKTCVVTFSLLDSPRGTSVTVEAQYELKHGLLGRILDALLVRRKFDGNLALMLAGLDAYLSTGEPVRSDFRVAAMAV